jgi:activator of HSP90 ATPase
MHMPTESLELSWILAAKPGDIYRAWLDSKAHSTFTGGAASIEPGVGGKFTAWDGYIQGKTLELKPARRIVQSWRTAEFPEGSTDSLVELVLVPVEEGTRLTLRHLDIPEGQGEKYRKGWDEFYITPMTRFFSSAPIPPKKAAPRKKSTKKTAAKKSAAKKAPAKRGSAARRR